MGCRRGDGGWNNVSDPTGKFLNNSSPNEFYNSGAGNPQLVVLNPGQYRQWWAVRSPMRTASPT